MNRGHTITPQLLQHLMSQSTGGGYAGGVGGWSALPNAMDGGLHTQIQAHADPTMPTILSNIVQQQTAQQHLLLQIQQQLDRQQVPPSTPGVVMVTQAAQGQRQRANQMYQILPLPGKTPNSPQFFFENLP
jgi:hypothetical protein